MGERDYRIRLGHRDRIRVQFLTERGQVKDFVLQYEAEIAGRWHAVVRYDLAHGFLHRDRLDPRGELSRKDPVIHGTLGQAMTEAIRDLKASFHQYRQWYKGRL
jgi:hypothetical protein